MHSFPLKVQLNENIKVKVLVLSYFPSLDLHVALRHGRGTDLANKVKIIAISFKLLCGPRLFK